MQDVIAQLDVPIMLRVPESVLKKRRTERHGYHTAGMVQPTTLKELDPNPRSPLLPLPTSYSPFGVHSVRTDIVSLIDPRPLEQLNPIW